MLTCEGCVFRTGLDRPVTITQRSLCTRLVHRNIQTNLITGAYTNQQMEMDSQMDTTQTIICLLHGK